LGQQVEDTHPGNDRQSQDGESGNQTEYAWQAG
jgi:hypothetical protein